MRESTQDSKAGRPIIRKIEIDATAEEIARAIFAAAKPPDPSRRIPTKRKISDR